MTRAASNGAATCKTEAGCRGVCWRWRARPGLDEVVRNCAVSSTGILRRCAAQPGIELRASCGGGSSNVVAKPGYSPSPSNACQLRMPRRRGCDTMMWIAWFLDWLALHHPCSRADHGEELVLAAGGESEHHFWPDSAPQSSEVSETRCHQRALPLLGAEFCGPLPVGRLADGTHAGTQACRPLTRRAVSVAQALGEFRAS